MKTIASHNGLAAAEKAYELLQADVSPLDACTAGLTIIEDDPEELTVGYGGLPNEAGVVELDAAVMDGPTHRGAGVAALQNIRHPTRVARLLLEQTHRSLLVGAGALEFAKANGFPEENLLTERARTMWLYWKRSRSQHDDWLAPAADADLEVQQWFEKHFYGTAAPEGSKLEMPSGGTVHCSALDAGSDMACATSTSGHAFKLPGRVGDSPILGAGLYVDNEVGSCGSIGHGEANQENLSSFAVVELMRQGMKPLEAGLEALRRIAAKAHSWQRDQSGRPAINVQLFILAKNGAHAGVSLWPGKQIAVCDSSGGRLEKCTALFEE